MYLFILLYIDLFKLFIVTAKICSRISVGLQASFFWPHLRAGGSRLPSSPPPSGCWDHPVDWDSRETPRASAAPQDQPARPPSSPLSSRLLLLAERQSQE